MTEQEKNHALCDEEWQKGATTVTSTPRIVTIETTSVCNIKCVMCPHGLDDKNMTYEHFPENLVPKLKEVIHNASIVQLHGLGEPMMNPAFWDMLKMTHKNQHVAINTNGILLNKKNVDRMLATWIGEINFSLDAATHETYQKIRGADFNLVLNNLRYLISERKRLKRDRPYIFMNMTLMRENIEEAVKFVELCHELKADQVHFWQMNQLDEEKPWRVERDGWSFDYHQQLLSKHPKLSNEMIRKAKERAKELGVHLALDWAKKVFFDEDDSPEPEKKKKTENKKPETFSPKQCNAPWNWMLIKTDGYVVPCCFGTGTLGNINALNPLEIWNGRVTRELRGYLLSDRIHPTCSSGVCKFISGRKSEEVEKRWSAHNISKNIQDMVWKTFVVVKTTAKKVVGENFWQIAKPRYLKLRSKVIRFINRP
ncbi:hypothetical protein MNBD_NITROSPINAE01-378 [hydrothermal vent metagenome]|uniref:Radical SAM core domain-containing protein n=1 Tax=hydrothermal vent metagenome TaxID=652676 RepID=A0A3B1CAD1_9ZZZZ